MRKILLGILFTFFASTVFSSTALKSPVGDVVFIVKGNILKKNTDTEAQFDSAMLFTFKQTKITTNTPWTEGKSTFEGVLLKDLMIYLEASGTEIVATALNGYRIVLPFQDILDYPVILALKQDNSILSIRKRGPSWLIYPWDKHPDIQSSKYYMRSIWQIATLEIR